MIPSSAPLMIVSQEPAGAATVPYAPTIGPAYAGDASAIVSFVSNGNGGSAITGHTATSTPGGHTGTGASPITVTSLSNGTAYTFTVHDTNAIGDSTESSSSNSVTPHPPYNYATWDAANKGAGILLSNGNLTAQAILAHTVLTTIGKSSGKHYIEITYPGTAASGGSVMMGIAQTGSSVIHQFWIDATGFAYSSFNGEKYNNNSGSAYGTNFETGTAKVISLLINMTDGELSFWYEGADQGVAFTGLSGTFYVAFCGNTAGIATANFGASAFTYSVPAGYNSGLYV